MKIAIAVEPTICHLCGQEILILNGIAADADVDPNRAFEDLIEHDCEGEDVEES